MGRAGRARLQPRRHPRVRRVRSARRHLGAKAHDGALLHGRARARAGALPCRAGSVHVPRGRGRERILHGRPVRVDACVPARAVSDRRARLGDLAGLRRHPLSRRRGTAAGRVADRDPGRDEHSGLALRARLYPRRHRDAVRGPGNEGPSPPRVSVVASRPMERAPRYGLSLPNRGVLFGATSVDELLAISEQADASSAFDSIWVGDSLFAKPRLESLVLLSAIAARTRRVRLGTCCLSTFPLRDPLFLAAQWAALDHVSSGRMILGACVGGSLPREKAEAEFAPFKVRLADRGPRLEEGIGILRRLWTEDRVSHEGRFYHFRELTLEPKPVQKPCPPIWIATNPRPELTKRHVMDRALERVARLADGWMTDNTPVARFKERWGFIREVARKAGRPTESMESALHLMVNINDDRTAGFDEAVKFLQTYYSPAMTRDYIEGWLACGPPAAVLDKIRAYVDAGCTTPILRFASWDQKGQLARTLAEVLPAALALTVSS